MNLFKIRNLQDTIDARVNEASSALAEGKPDDAAHAMKFARHAAEFMVAEMLLPGVIDESVVDPTAEPFIVVDDKGRRIDDVAEERSVSDRALGHHDPERAD